MRHRRTMKASGAGRWARLRLGERLTPQERQSLWLVLGLFLLGLAVRWWRLGHAT